LLMFVPLAGLVERRMGTTRLAMIILVIAIITSMGLYVFVPAMNTYAGVSAVSYGLIAWWCLENRRRFMLQVTAELRVSIADLVLGFMLSRCFFAALGDQTLPDMDNIAVAWQAHLFAMGAAMLGRVGKGDTDNLTT